MSKLHCAILDDYQQVAMTMADWSLLSDKVQVTAFHEHFEHEDQLVAALAGYHIVVLMRERTPFRSSLFSRLPHLRLLITTGMRNASVDLDAAAQHGVMVCGTGSLATPPVELTWALILGLARKLIPENDQLRTNGPWQNSVGADLYGKQLGLLGLGRIGSKVAQIGLAFGMQVSAWSQNLTEERTNPLGVRLAASKEELLKMSDFVSIHLVLSERTHHLINLEDFRRMRPSSYFINTSRAQIVNQSALIEAIQKKWISGAGIDVFEMEPLPKNHPLRVLPNVLATPHLGYVTQANYNIYYQETVQNIQAFLADRPIRRLA